MLRMKAGIVQSKLIASIMERKYLYGVGILAATAAAVILLVRKMGYTNVATAIQSAMGNYFTIQELCASTTAKQKGIDNTPSAAVKTNLQKLITNLLNPIREAYGKPIVISSGYRCPALNAAVGGVANSQHVTGQAADLQATSSGSLADIFRAAVKVGGYDQLIIEHAKNTVWVHISYSDNPRREMFSYNGGSYTKINTSNFELYIA